MLCLVATEVRRHTICLPKGSAFDELMQGQVLLMIDHINILWEMGKNNSENSGKQPNRKLVRQKQKPKLEPEITLAIN